MRDFFAKMEWTALPVLGLWLFIAIFAAVALRIFAFRQPRGTEQLPLPTPNSTKDDEGKGQGEG